MSEAEKQKQALEVLGRDIELKVKGGFDELDDLADDCAHLAAELEEVDVEFLRPHARRLLTAAIARHRKDQRTWPLVTDFDRLQRAFDRLESTGVVCRHNFSCCGTCASGEIWDEIEAEQQAGRTIRGAAHYNQQDAEGVVEYGNLYFSYTAAPYSEEAAVAIGREIEAALTREGLECDWDGTLSKRVGVKLDWKRRLPA